MGVQYFNCYAILNKMRPLFTIHAGEFIVGEFLQKKFPDLNIWIPAKDAGIDLLITNKNNNSSISVQVKITRDYKKLEATSIFDENLIAAGWLSLSHKKIAESPADYWVIVLISHERKMKPQFIVIPPRDLLRKLTKVHGESNNYNFYPWVMKSEIYLDGDSEIALDGRGLLKADKDQLSNGGIEIADRDFSQFLNNWSSFYELSQEIGN